MTALDKDNPYLTGALGAIYVRTAIPIIFVMSMNGLLAVVDAYFLGRFVGPEALAAVTLMFPLYMLVVALATLVASGMSSLLARRLGARRIEEARAVFAGAHGLALAASGALILLFLLFGRDVATLVAAGAEDLAAIGLVYLRITVFASPLIFVLSAQADALRNEGRVGFMAAMSLFVSLANIGLDYVLIVHAGLGVAGSALATAFAQALALAIILTFRAQGRARLRPGDAIRRGGARHWREILALGAPQSLNFVGVALLSAAVIAALQMVETPDYAATASAYGVVTRVMTFIFLPLLGLSQAMQTITGNNYGAGAFERSDRSLRIALVVALVYCATAEIVLTTLAGAIGGVLVESPEVVAEVARILPVIVTLYVFAGPQMMVAAYFQALGDAARAALLGLSKPYLFSIPLTFGLAATVGEWGIWVAGPVAEAMLVLLTLVTLTFAARRRSLRWGLFTAAAAVGQSRF